MDSTVFGRRLRHAREDRGWSQQQLADGICAASSISRWEGGAPPPGPDILVALARRLGVDVTVLTGAGYDPRLALSPESFGALLHAAFPGETINTTGYPGSEVVRWMSLAGAALRDADPWLAGDPQPAVDELAVHELTPTSPVGLETVQLLEAMTALKRDMVAAQVENLVDTLTWTPDAPGPFREAAIERAVACYVLAGMPVSASGIVARTNPSCITAATAVLLRHDGGGQRVNPAVSARDAALLAIGAAPGSAALIATAFRSDRLIAAFAALPR
ncbi:helix-turn-helix domain-containing protein [Corynebacterium sp.]|uniref:helix-turn-helix domain-containing protein n=1 Tax=Corynebacterium sp. TaxID=1720 RepID=UPI0026DB9EF1|nr:helix-turn-helix domain-containing protein [Corynebacterium sp.]MDO4610320.1 helix-turn-helix domain-containing protein [Corynebacterium sp.]